MRKPNGWQRTNVTKEVWEPPTSTEWDALLKTHEVTERDAAAHPGVRRWVEKNCRRRYVPSKVLDALCIEVNYEWGDA